MDGYRELDDFLADTLNDEAYRQPKSRRERVGRILFRAFMPYEEPADRKSSEYIGDAAIAAALLALNQFIDVRTGINPLEYAVQSVIQTFSQTR